MIGFLQFLASVLMGGAVIASFVCVLGSMAGGDREMIGLTFVVSAIAFVIGAGLMSFAQ